VLDDDPTGTQTVHDVPVLTEWTVEALACELANDLSCLYVLHNSRSMAPNSARELNLEIARNLHEAANITGRTFAIISRSDSTLRGHFPVETDALNEILGPFDSTFLIPYFEAGGRYTVDDIHYVADGDTLVPVASTAFARDAVFGYRSSNMRDYVEEKSAGRIRAADVQSIGISELRIRTPERGSAEQIASRLLALPRGAVCIVNACHPRDLEVFALGSISAEKAGARFLYRTAAQYVAARLGMGSRPLWRATSYEGTGGLIVIGSHMPRTTEQLNCLCGVLPLERLELSVSSLLAPDRQEGEIAKVARVVNTTLEQDRKVVVFTSRALVTGTCSKDTLEIGARVSDALVSIVRRLSVRPRYIVAKGGITSSDIATKGLDVKRAWVVGQILPGIPVWILGPETRFHRMPYIVFPGNVGGPDALLKAVEILDSIGSSDRQSPVVEN
jgi:uncharacterized protein YgbK (DUF1537 family)